MVRAGEDVAHQLPRDAGSCPCNPDLSERSNWVISVTENGQYHRSGLRQQPRGNSIPTVDHPGEDIMDVGTPEGHHVDSPTHIRCVKYSSGHRIQDGQGLYRLEIEPRDLQPDQPNLWATRSGLVCIQTDSPTAPLLQLETRPASRSNGCFSAGLETQDWVCQPTLVPYGESSESSDGTGSPDRPSGSSVEGSTLVPSPSKSIVEVPSTDPLTPGPDSEPLRTGAAGTDAPVSHVAYLREKFNDSSLSEEASSLLLASWRSKSSQSYDSHFRKWLSWCAQRGSNPVSGPVAEVANFLAYLFQQGYQSRSLNAYRSAISSVHDRVDGVEVGKCHDDIQAGLVDFFDYYHDIICT